MDLLQPIIIDDSDLQDILYQPTYLWAHDLGGQAFHASTFSNGFTNAQAQFKFNGTSVVVYGAQAPAPAGNQTAVPPSATFTIDGIFPMTVVGDPGVQTVQYGFRFLDLHALPEGEHVLQIDVKYGADDWPFVLDYIEYTPILAGASPSAVTATRSRAHTAAIVGGLIGGAVLLGLLAVAGWCLYRRKMRPSRLMKKYGHYVFGNADSKPDLADHFEVVEYKPTPTLPKPSTDTAPSNAVQETCSGQYHPSFIAKMGSTGSLSEMEFAHLSPPRAPTQVARGQHPSYMHVHRHQQFYLFFAPSHSSTPSAATAYGRPGCLPAPAPAVALSPSNSCRPVMSAMDPSCSTRSSRARLRLAPGSSTASSCHPSLATSPQSSKHAEADKAHWPLPQTRKPATFHADSGVRFTSDGEPSSAIAPPCPAPVSFLEMDPAAEMGKTAEEVGEEFERRRELKARYGVSFCGTAISEVPPVYTEQ